MQEMELFQLRHSGGEETEFVVCSNTEGSPWFYLVWNLGKPLKEKIEVPIVYYADKNLPLEDFPWGNSTEFLASPKLLGILKKSGARFDVYRSIIRFPDSKEIDNYVAINFLESWPVVDRQRSKFEPDPDFPTTKIYKIEKLVAKRSLLPEAQIFLMAENSSWLLVKKALKEEMERNQVTGIEFTPVPVS